MNKIIIAIVAFCTLGINLQAQRFVREYDTQSERPLLRGQITFDDITDESAYGWIHNEYETNTNVIAKIKKLLPKYRIVAFIGTWCEDTQYLLPQFYQTLKDASFDFNALEMYGVNRSKEGLNVEHKIYNIQRVPTIIIMDRFKEIGRIVETSKKTIEQDILDILEGNS